MADLVSLYYTSSASLSEDPNAPEEPHPPMSPPPPYDVLYTYELKNTINRYTAALLWSIFSATDGIYFDDDKPVNRIISKTPIDVNAFHKKITEMSIICDIRCFDSVYILPACIIVSHL